MTGLQKATIKGDIMRKKGIKNIIILSLMGLTAVALYGGVKTLNVTADSLNTV